MVLATLGVPTLSTPGMLPVAGAVSCPDAELIFARGRMESPGAGQIGNALASALRSKSGKNVALYAVKYPCLLYTSPSPRD